MATTTDEKLKILILEKGISISIFNKFSNYIINSKQYWGGLELAETRILQSLIDYFT